MARPPFMNAPGPQPSEMVSNISQIRKLAPEFLVQMRDKYGSVVQFPIPKPHTYLVSDPKWVDYVLRANSKNYGKATIQYRTLALVTGFGLLAADTDKWRSQRKVVQPAFHHDSLHQVVAHSAAAAAEVIKNLKQSVELEIDLDQEMMQLALNVVGSALFGSDFQANANQIVKATLHGLDVVVSRARTPIFPPIWLPTPLNLKLYFANRTLNRAVDQIISTAQSSTEADTIAALLVAEMKNGNLTKAQVRDELVTFIVAGHETVASALSWTLHLISDKPQLQADLKAEVNRVVGDRPPTFNDYLELKLFQSVLNEAMRLYPPAWVLTRNALDVDQIAGYSIAPGSLIVISPWVVHRDAASWPSPNDFDPTRFDANSRPTAGSFIPFGLGNRMCIGRDFAMVEGVIALAMLLQEFKFQPSEKSVTPLPSVTVRPKSGLWLKLIVD